MDICINAILARTDKSRINKQFYDLCSWIYPTDSRTTILALCNPSITSEELRKLPVDQRELWKELYANLDSNEKAFLPSITHITPEDLYFRLKPQWDSNSQSVCVAVLDGGLNPFGRQKEKKDGSDNTVTLQKGGQGTTRDPDSPDIPSSAERRMEAEIKRSLLPKRLRFGGGACNIATDYWEECFRDPEEVDNSDLSEYAKKIHTQKMIEDLAGDMTKALVPGTTHDVYPKMLTEEGTLLACLGMKPPNFPFFLNMEGDQGKKRLVAFFDLSPSMEHFFQYMAYLCGILENDLDMVFARNDDGDAGMLSFAGSIKELTSSEFEDMKKGNLIAGCSTSFDEVVAYCNEKIDTDDVDAVLVFTDGESCLSEENIQEFRAREKNMYRVYMIDEHDEREQVESDLDVLPGESFTLRLPKTDASVI